jgi:N-hydroxyarylamine O-acetyltransferase
VLRGVFGLNVSDDELGRMLEIVEQRGAKGAPHPFFA